MKLISQIQVGVAVFVAWHVFVQRGLGQSAPASRDRLARDQFKSGETTLQAFAPVSAKARDSVVKLDLDGNTVALAAIIDADGLAVTKGSEMKPGKLTAWLVSGQEVEAELLSVDQENDLALVRVDARGLQPVRWAQGDVVVGQWVLTPGVAEQPQAVGIISVPPRKILPKRAMIGVQLDGESSPPRISRILPGMGAEKAGLKSGDVVLAVNDAPMKEGEALATRLRQFRDGQVVKLRIKRADQELDAQITMMLERPESGARGFDRADRMNRMGSRPSERSEDFKLVLQHDTVLQNWQCGGPLMNLEGKAIGINIARAGRVASYALPADLVTHSIQRLQASARSGEGFKDTSNTSHLHELKPNQ